MLSLLGVGQLIALREDASFFVAELGIISATKEACFSKDEIMMECIITDEEVKKIIRRMGKFLRPDRQVLLSFAAKYEGFKTSFPDPFGSKPSQIVLLHGHLYSVIKGWVNVAPARVANSSLTHYATYY